MEYTDLHLHLEGSQSSEDLKLLSWLDSEAEIELPYDDDEVDRLLNYKNSNHLSLPISLLQTEENLKFAIDALAKRLKSRNISYAEIRITPQYHTKRGMTQMSVVESILDGYTERLDFTGEDMSSPLKLKLMKYENATGIDLGLNTRPEYPHIRFILSLIRGNMRDPKLYEMNMETVEIARHFMSDNNYLIAGLDLEGAEGVYPIDDYMDFIGAARKYHIPFTIHAGENGDPKGIWDAIRIGASRIGHGITAVKDSRLMSELAERGTVLELCPSAELMSGAVETMDKYPLRLLMQYGIKATINSDYMVALNTDVANEFDILKRELMLSDSEIQTLMKNAEEAHL